MTPSEAYTVLVETCGARENGRNDFVYHLTKFLKGDDRFPFEHRFQGSLGFGGKFYCTYYKRATVGCYLEDETPDRKTAIKKANEKLADFYLTEQSK